MRLLGQVIPSVGRHLEGFHVKDYGVDMNNNVTTPLLTIIIVGAFTVGLVFAVMGILLVILGASGDTDFSFFGQTMKTSNVGIVAICIGATTTILLLRRTIKTIEMLIGRQTSGHDESGVKKTLNVWPFERTPESLTKKLMELSETQRKIIMIVSQTFSGVVGGWPQEEIANKIQINEGEVHYRLRDLEHLRLIEKSSRTHGVVYKLPADVESLVDQFAIVQNALKSPDKFTPNRVKESD